MHGLLDELKVALVAIMLDLQKPKCSKALLVLLLAKLEVVAFNGHADSFGIAVFIIACSDELCRRDNDDCVLVSYASALKTESSGDLNMRTDERSCFMSSAMQEVTIALRASGSTSEALIAVPAYSSIVLG